jgi:hypothetical protein
LKFFFGEFKIIFYKNNFLKIWIYLNSQKLFSSPQSIRDWNLIEILFFRPLSSDFDRNIFFKSRRTFSSFKRKKFRRQEKQNPMKQKIYFFFAFIEVLQILMFFSFASLEMFIKIKSFSRYCDSFIFVKEIWEK